MEIYNSLDKEILQRNELLGKIEKETIQAEEVGGHSVLFLMFAFCPQRSLSFDPWLIQTTKIKTALNHDSSHWIYSSGMLYLPLGEVPGSAHKENSPQHMPEYNLPILKFCVYGLTKYIRWELERWLGG